jgi:PAS domain S-box-containing protein
VLVAESDPALREAIRALISGVEGLELVGTAGDADGVLELAGSADPDVVLVDVRMPGGGGSRVARELPAICAEARVLALSAHDDRSHVLELLRAGAVGYLVKGTPAEEIVEAIRRAARGQGSLPAALVAELAERLEDEEHARADADTTRRRGEQQFRKLLESAPDAAVVIDELGEIVHINQQTERLFGYPREQLIGKTIELLLPPRFRDGHLARRRCYFAHPGKRPMGAGLELAGRRRDGGEFPVDVSLSTVESDRGTLAIAFVRDISERVSFEVGRRMTPNRFEPLLEAAPDAVVVVESGGRIVLANSQTEELFGYRREELLGELVELLLPLRHRGRHVGERVGYLAEPRKRAMGAGLELAGRRKDGTEFPVDVALSSIETEEGRLVAAFVREVSLREARLDLEGSIGERHAVLAHLVWAGEEDRRRIAGDIHDDSIQVMTAAGMRLEILRRALSDPSQLERLAELEHSIHLSIARLRHLIFELRPPALDNEGLSAALEMYLEETERAGGPGYQLDDRLPHNPPEVTRVILYRVAQEVLQNIRRHAAATHVAVTLETREGGYYMRIRDDGIGFLPARASLKPGHLGLAAIRERATLAGGWLRIESAPGEGASIEFWVPLEAQGQVGDPERNPSA